MTATTSSDNTGDAPGGLDQEKQIDSSVRSRIVKDANGATACFVLRGKDGVDYPFKCDSYTVAAVALELSILGKQVQQAEGGSVDSFFLPFETTIATTTVLDTEGSIIFWFRTPNGYSYQTILGPKLAAQLAGDLLFALSNLPKPPEIWRSVIPGTTVPGTTTNKKSDPVYFGQSYPVDIIQALGMLMIRANLLEQSLIELLAWLSQLSIRKARALFFSTVNMKARVDMINSLIPIAGLEEDVVKRLEGVFKRVNSVTKRRNKLVHGFWSAHNGKYKIATTQPSSHEKMQDLIVDATYIETLAANYREAGIIIKMIIETGKRAPPLKED